MIRNSGKNKRTQKRKCASASAGRIVKIIASERAEAVEYSRVQKQIRTAIAKSGSTPIGEIDRKTAIRKLQRIGILDSNGKIAEPYRSKKV